MRGVLVYGMQDCGEVLLAQLVYVVVHNELKALESRCRDLVTVNKLRSLRDRENHESPALILELLPASLDDLLHSFKGLQLIGGMAGL